MRICIVQCASEKGDIQANIENHLKLIQSAIRLGSDLIVFPELSVTGYEPALAKKLAFNMGDMRLKCFQQQADEHHVTIGIGLPTQSNEGVHISMMLFQPQQPSSLYSKQQLHQDELPYFAAAKNQYPVFDLGMKVAFGICYETLTTEHFQNAAKTNADIFIASVAKPDRGVEKAYIHFPTMAKEFNMPILMANCIGFCDDFMSIGRSSFWDKTGELKAQLDEKSEGLLFYDTELDRASVVQDS